MSSGATISHADVNAAILALSKAIQVLQAAHQASYSLTALAPPVVTAPTVVTPPVVTAPAPAPVVTAPVVTAPAPAPTVVTAPVPAPAPALTLVTSPVVTSSGVGGPVRPGFTRPSPVVVVGDGSTLTSTSVFVSKYTLRDILYTVLHKCNQDHPAEFIAVESIKQQCVSLAAKENIQCKAETFRQMLKNGKHRDIAEHNGQSKKSGYRLRR